MNLSIALAGVHNLQAGLSILGNRPAFTDAEYQQFTRTLDRLLQQHRVFGRIVVDSAGDRPRVFGLSAFVDRAYVDGYLASPYGEVGKRLVLHDSAAILDQARIAEGNRRSGLHSVVLAEGFDPAGTVQDGFEWVYGTGMRAFGEAHRGYRIERLVNVGHSEIGTNAVIEGGGWKLVGRFVDHYDTGVVHTGVVTLTKCEALRMRTLLLPIFLYAPPRVCFTPSERDLLRAAVSGATDAEIARVVKISVSAVKARWSRTYSRFFARFPESERRHCRSGSRGEQIRHVLLEYVRTHPSELTPY